MTDTEKLLQLAESFGEAQVIRDVAARAGLMWTCLCGTDVFGLYADTCPTCFRGEQSAISAGQSTNKS